MILFMLRLRTLVFAPWIAQGIKGSKSGDSTVRRLPMAETKNLTAEQMKQAAAEEMWLNYYNNVLFEKGLISEEVRNRMAVKISARNPYKPKTKIRYRER